MKTISLKKKSPFNLVNFIIIVFCLYFAREIFIPLALAILLSFILFSFIDILQKYNFPKTLAIWTIVFFTFFLMACVGWIIYLQAIQLAQNIPKYETNVRSKLDLFMSMNKRVFSNIQEATSVLKKIESTNESNKQKPIPVELPSTKPSLLMQIMQLSPLLNPLGTGLLVLVMLPYILFNRQDLRERLILLISQDDLNLATQAIDDTGLRITRYLLGNLGINGVLGVCIGLGLYVIGIPNAFLWGFLTMFLRFIPYLGVWVAASFPLIVAFAVDPGWSSLVLTVFLYIGVEMATNYFFEPRLYGASTGISAFALILTSIFWTWLWGISGLFLSVPLTVCIFMLGKYVAGLEFLEILLGSQPFLNPPRHLYQCLLARDKTGILNISKDYLKNTSLFDYYDQLLIPALSLAKKDRFDGTLAEHRQQFILDNANTLINLEEKNTKTPKKMNKGLPLICLSARDEFDELVSCMLQNLLYQEGIEVLVIDCLATLEDINRRLGSKKKYLICISSLPPYALSPARHLYKKLKKIYPSSKIVIGIWGAMPSVSHLESAWEGCAATVVTLKEMVVQLKALLGMEKDLQHPINKRTKNLQASLDEDLAHLPLSELPSTVLKKVAKVFDVPMSLISILEIDPHFWKDYPNILPVPNEAAENLSQSLVSSYVSTSNETLVVPNVKKDPRFCKDALLSDRGILFFAGTPLRSDDDHVVALLCVLDTESRKMKKKDLLVLEALAKIFMDRILNA